MKIEQHIYTSVGREDFASIAVTPQINREERIKLENHSLYILPTQLLYEEKKAKPIKYVFYPLDENRLVIGKAVYTGKDNQGRPGNYFFHNLIFSKEELIKFDVNSVQLIRYIEKKGIFRERVTNESLQMLELPVGGLKEFKFKKPQIPNEFIKSLIYFCFNAESITNSFLITGSDRECLDFLEWLYEFLPYGLKEKISFDTYGYGTNLGFKIVGNPHESEFQQSINYSLRLDLKTKSYIANFEVEEASELVSYVTEKVCSGDIADLKSVYFLQGCLQKNDFGKFKEAYKGISLQSKNFIYRLYKKAILGRILTEKDTELLGLVVDKLGPGDISTLSSSFEIIAQLVETEDKKISGMFIDWFCLQEDKELFFSLLFKSMKLWNIFLDRLKDYPEDMIFLFEDEAIVVFKDNYSEQLEETLLRAIFSLLEQILRIKKLTKGLIQLLNKLPQPQSENVSLFRAFIKYELTNEPLLLNELISSDVSILSEKHQEAILVSILKGIIESSKLEEMPKQLNLLFEKAKDKQNLISSSLSLLKQHEIPNKTKKVFKSIFLELADKLPQNEETKSFKDTADKLFEIKPSFIRQLLGRKDKG